jgi:hypothetical protein
MANDFEALGKLVGKNIKSVKELRQMIQTFAKEVATLKGHQSKKPAASRKKA